jgi:hypothetical protein
MIVQLDDLTSDREMSTQMDLDVTDEETNRSTVDWRNIELATMKLSQELAEQLRLVMEPTLASKLQGDYRTGKRINMKKVPVFSLFLCHTSNMLSLFSGCPSKGCALISNIIVSSFRLFHILQAISAGTRYGCDVQNPINEITRWLLLWMTHEACLRASAQKLLLKH